MKAVGHADQGTATRAGIARVGLRRGSHEPPTVLIVDDHPVYRDGLARAVEACDELRLVAEAGDGREAIERIEELRPEVAAVDMRMPEVDGLGVLAAVGSGESPTRVLILSAYLDGDIAYRALAEGAAGYLAKDSSRQAICDAIITVARGGVALCADVETDLAAEIRKRTRIERDVLTDRELEILQGVAGGGSAAVIGATLHLSPTTVKSHLRSIYAKLAVGDRAAAVAEAMRRGLLE